MNKVITAFRSNKTQIARRALILAGTAVGVAIAFVAVSKISDSPDIIVVEESDADTTGE